MSSSYLATSTQAIFATLDGHLLAFITQRKVIPLLLICLLFLRFAASDSLMLQIVNCPFKIWLFSSIYPDFAERIIYGHRI